MLEDWAADLTYRFYGLWSEKYSANEEESQMCCWTSAVSTKATNHSY